MINYNDYHPKWSLISMAIRRTRAANRCEWCDAENGKPHPVTGSRVMLTVAHLDQDRNNNRFWNLAALCQRCHLNHDRQQHIFSRRYGRQTKYVCGRLFQLPRPRVITAPVHTVRYRLRTNVFEEPNRFAFYDSVQVIQKKKKYNAGIQL